MLVWSLTVDAENDVKMLSLKKDFWYVFVKPGFQKSGQYTIKVSSGKVKVSVSS